MGHDYEKLTEKARSMAHDWRNQDEERRARKVRLDIVEKNYINLKAGLEKFENRIQAMKVIFSMMPKQEARAIMDIMEMPHIQEKARAYKLGMEVEQYRTFIADAWRSFGYAMEQMEGWESL